MNILVLNCGSSSIKYQLLDMTATPTLLAKGIVEKIGLPTGLFTHKPVGKAVVKLEPPIPTHTEGIELVLKYLTDPVSGVIPDLKSIDAVGHRVAHGGEYFSESVKIDESVKAKIQALCAIAPLHNPAHMKGIETMERLLPNVPQVAVFDTSFHQTIPAKAYMYGLPYEYYEKYGIRRYGFHGTSHRFVSEKACGLLGWNIADKKIITCHLGNGSSITAIDGGKSVDTSMGFTPTAGVVMGTRTGDIDPSALLYIMEKENLSVDAANTLINKKSGLQGLSQLSFDCRDLRAAAENGNDKAILALDMLSYTVKRFVGAYTAVLGGVDLIIFTGGIGENVDLVRRNVCDHMDYLGLKIDDEANSAARGTDMVISTPDSRVKVMVIATDEELVIAQDTKRLA